MNNKWLTFAIVIIGLYLLSLGIVTLYNYEKGNFENDIAIIPIKGPITMEGQSLGFGSGDSVSSNTIVSFIKEANNNPSVKGIILEINSPGGTVLASKEIADEVKNSKKPVVAVIREFGASGAYWIASATDYIIADQMSITGSIGVIGSYLEFSGLFEEYGITYQELKAGEYKDAGSPFKPLTPNERAFLQKNINVIHEEFIQTVATNRNMSLENTRDIADGRFYLGTEAKELGLIDAYGNMDEGIKKVEELANISNATTIRYEQEHSIFDVLTGVSAQGAYHFGRGFAREMSSISTEQTLQIRAE